MVTALIIIILASIVSFALYVGISSSTPYTQEPSGTKEHNNMRYSDDITEYMTKEELIETFYCNFDAFSDVANHVLSMSEFSGGIRINEDGDKVIMHDNGVVTELDVDEFEVGAQIKLICGLGFGGVGQDTAGTRAFFTMHYYDPPPDVGIPGSRGVVYVPGGLDDVSPQDILEKENWYYLFARFD